MTRCRAKMIDGSPVTFDWIDLGGMQWHDVRTGNTGICAPYTTEMVGEGFHVRSEWPEVPVRPMILREECDRLALERSGVDTATAERWDPPTQRAAGEMVFRYMGNWVPLFPPIKSVSHTPVMDALPGYFNEVEPTPKMMDAGAAEGGRCWALQVGNQETIRRVWRAMEKARR